MTQKSILRWVLYPVYLLIALIIICVLVIRFVIFPNIDSYKTDIADYLGQTLDRKVSIGDIQTGWHNFSPRMSLSDINIYDEENRPALNLNQIDTELSWLSLGVLDVRLAELTAHQPNLVIRRTKENTFYVAGISTSAGDGNPKFGNWLISQPQVNIKNANVTYIDELRNAPPLSLEKLNFSLSNVSWRSILGRHQFNLSAVPSVGSKAPINVAGYFVGSDINASDQWYGELATTIKETDLTVWKPWVDYPVTITSGSGNVTTAMQFSHNTIKKLETTLKLTNIGLLGNKSVKPLNIKQLDGDIEWNQKPEQWSVATRNLNLISDTGLKIEQANGLYLQTIKNGEDWVDANFAIQHLSLHALKNTANLFQLPASLSAYIDGMNPRGNVNDLKLVVAGPVEAPTEYQVNAKFSKLSANAYQKIPGFKNISGEIDSGKVNGQLIIDTKKAELSPKNVLRWPVPIDTLQAHINWQTIAGNTSITIQDFYINNAHLSGHVKGSYKIKEKASDAIDITGNFTRADGKNAKFYYPYSIGKDSISWLDKSIIKGDLSDINLTLKGKMDDFPFVDNDMRPDPKKGTMKVTAQLDNAEVKFADSWPAGQDLSATLLFESQSMTLNVTKGHMLNQRIISTSVVIPDLGADWPILTANGVTEAPMQEAIHYINNSPVKKVTLGFTDTLKTAGNGRLNLAVNVPLKKSIDTTFKGSFDITNGTLFANTDVGTPELSQINGQLAFDDSGISAKQIHAVVAGGPAKLDITSQSDKTITIKAKGLATDTGLKETFDLAILKPIEGEANWGGEIIIKKPNVNISITSNLEGMAINAPSPMHKAAETTSHFSFKKIQSIGNQDTLEISYADLVRAKLLREESNNDFIIKKGIIGVNKPAEFTTESDAIKQGLVLNADLDQANLEEWIDFISESDMQSEGDDDGIRQANLSIKHLNVFGRSIENIKVQSTPTNTGLNLILNSDSLAGKAQWISTGNGKVIAQLSKLKIPKSEETPINSKKTEIKRLSKQYPALDITIDDFELGDKHLGSLALNAFENENSWIIQKLSIKNPDNTLTAEGTWHNWTQNPNTYLNFQLASNNIGNTLARFGHPDTVKRGNLSLKGRLQWPGSPHQFDAEHINGEIELLAKKGQILKVKPGVARLLGLISLQSLPRRLTLDFRDLFSEGFAFDEISATAVATNGVLHSNDFSMTGPAAEVKITGDISIKDETQALNVKVLPHVSDSLSIAAFAGGPIAGIAAFVAQKLLKDPLNKIVSTEYIVTGTWDNPKELQSKKEEIVAPSPLQ